MSDLLTEAKQILAGNRTEKAGRDLMTYAQRDALAADYAARGAFLSASHFHSSAKESKEFERLFYEKIRSRKNN